MNKITAKTPYIKQGNVDVYDFGTFKFHVYNSNDVMADTSFIIEGKDALVTMEEPLFKACVEEFDTYLKSLGKPVAEHIVDFHEGGTGDRPVVMAEGMHKFMHEGAYAAMMQGFQKAFGDSMVELATGKASEVKFGSTEVYAGVPFKFLRTVSTDFPATSILIGDAVWYSHWAPVKMHPSHLQISSPAAIKATIANLTEALATDATLFCGGHGGAVDKETAEFKLQYFEKMQPLVAENKTPETYITAIKEAYPSLAGEDNLNDLAAALYK